MMQVPESWRPHVQRDKIFWIWAPSEWSKTEPLSKGSCFALISSSGDVLLEVFALGADDRPDVEELVESIMKRSLLESHADLRIIREGLYQLEAADKEDALARMAELGLLTDYEFFADMRSASNCHRLIVEYAERVRPGLGMPTKTTTDCFFLRREDLLLQINIKTISFQYSQMTRTFEQIAGSAKLGRFVQT